MPAQRPPTCLLGDLRGPTSVAPRWDEEGPGGQAEASPYNDGTAGIVPKTARLTASMRTFPATFSTVSVLQSGER